jgi:AcrR family transcriptional regulator
LTFTPPAGRADARRNRERLIEAARVAFTSSDDAVALESVARDAGVGIGTLYRHFPTREALVEAVYEAELGEVVASSERLLHQHPADVALREWMDSYGRFLATKRGMIDTLRAGWASGRITTPHTRETVRAVLGGFLAAGAQQGVLRDDVSAEDATAGMLGVFLSTAASTEAEQVSRLLDLLIDGLRPRS